MNDTDIQDESVNDLIAQLRANTSTLATTHSNEDPLTKDKLEEFIIRKSGDLIAKSLNLVDRVQDYITSAPDSKDVEAVAGLISATSSAIDTLNRVYIADEKNKTQVKVKQIDIESREKTNMLDNQTKVLLSREEIVKALISDDKSVIDV